MRPSTLITVSLLFLGAAFLFWRFDGPSVFEPAVRGPVSLTPVKTESPSTEPKQAERTVKRNPVRLLAVAAGPPPAPVATAEAIVPAAATPSIPEPALIAGAGRKAVLESLGQPTLTALKIEDHELEEEFWYRPAGPHPVKITLREGRVTNVHGQP
jgi:hypothetical protein